MADRHYLWWKDASTAVPGGRWDRYAAYNSLEEALTQAHAGDGLVAVKITKDEDGDDVVMNQKDIKAAEK